MVVALVAGFPVEAGADKPCKDLTIDDLTVGDQVKVKIEDAENTPQDQPLLGYDLRCEKNHWEKLKGFVESVETDENGKVTSFQVLRTTIVRMNIDRMDR